MIELNILKEKNESQPELNYLKTNEINYGIKFTSVSSGRNIIIHGGGNFLKLLKIFLFLK